jgi:geranylgeranyl diphosphate synthase type II
MRAEDALREQKQAVDEELHRLLSGRESLLFQAMRHAVHSGGKRYRPLLLLSAGESLGAERGVLLPFACAVELIHCYSLVHDDLPAMDNDEFRRGQPTCHKAHGEDVALLAGDALLTLAFEVMASAPLPAVLAERRAEVMAEIGRWAGAEGMIEGQVLDIKLTPEQAAEEKLLDIILKKTGGLIIASVKAGAMLGRASASQVQALEDFGRNVGLAFQVRDDLLDSRPQAGRKPDSRPSLASLLGRRESQRRLDDYVRQALEALDGAGLRTAPLEHLARLLLDQAQG